MMEKLSYQRIKRKKQSSEQLYKKHCASANREVRLLNVSGKRQISSDDLESVGTSNYAAKALEQGDWDSIKTAIREDHLFAKVKLILSGDTDYSEDVLKTLRKSVNIGVLPKRDTHVTVLVPRKSLDIDRDEGVKTSRLLSSIAKSQDESPSRVFDIREQTEKCVKARNTNMYTNFLKKHPTNARRWSGPCKKGCNFDLESYVDFKMDQVLKEFTDWLNETLPPSSISVKYLRDLFALTYNEVIPDSIKSLTVTVEELNVVESSVASHDQDMQRSTGAMLYRQIYRDIKASTATPRGKELYQDWLHIKRIPHELITMLGTFGGIEDLASTRKFYKNLNNKGITPPQHLSNYYNKQMDPITWLHNPRWQSRLKRMDFNVK